MSGFLRLGLALTTALATTACPKPAGDGPPATLNTGDQVKVVTIVKGDEVVVDKDGQRAHVRLLGVHAMEAVIDDPAVVKLSRLALTYLSVNVLEQTVSLTLGDPLKDPLGRYLGYLNLRGEDVNRKLIEQGLAINYTEFAHTREADYAVADADVRAAQRGLWGEPGTQKMILGLRRMWAQSRAERTTEQVADPLLAPAATP